MPKQVKMPSPSDSTNAPSVMPEPEGSSFLKPEEVKDGEKITILGNIGGSTQWSDFTIQVRHGKNERTLGLKVKSMNYALLYERFGSNPTKWKGATFQVRVAQNMGKDYVQLY